MVDVKGRWAFVTGASRGIGYLAAMFMANADLPIEGLAAIKTRSEL